MNILLIGEFSRLHNSLKEGLIKLGYDVLLIGEGDHFKNYPVDIFIGPTFFNKLVTLFFRKSIHKLTKLDIADLHGVVKISPVDRAS